MLTKNMQPTKSGCNKWVFSTIIKGLCISYVHLHLLYILTPPYLGNVGNLPKIPPSQHNLGNC